MWIVFLIFALSTKYISKETYNESKNISIVYMISSLILFGLCIIDIYKTYFNK